MSDNDDGRRGGWRILLGADDGAELRQALLAAGRARRDAGKQVVIGCSESSRPGAGELDGMAVLPNLPDPDRAGRIDLAAIRERCPDVVLVDNLAQLVAHDDERIPDIDAIRSLGIDVVSTLRADDVRSLAQQPSTRSRPWTTVPERALLEADDIEVIAGDDTSERVAAARRWGEQHRLRRRADGPSWPGRIVVAFDAARDAVDVIDRAAELARAADVHLVGANVRRLADDSGAGALREREEQLEALDADVVQVVDDDPGWALARVAEAEGAQVVVQRGAIDGRLVLDVPTAGVRGIDLYVVAPSAGHVDAPPAPAGTGADARSASLPRRRQAAGYIAAVVGIPLLTLALAGVRESVHLSTVLLLFLAVTVAVTAVGGRGPALVAAVGGFALGDYFFTRPHFRWVIDDPNVIIAMIVFVVVAVTVSALVDTATRRAAEAARARAEATALAHLASAVLTSREPLPRLLHDLRAAFDLDAVAILRRADDGWVAEHAIGGPVPRRPADATDALAIGPQRYLALVGPRTPAEDSRVLAAFTAQLALVTDRRTAGDPT